jgi:hypothetical protein
MTKSFDIDINYEPRVVQRDLRLDIVDVGLDQGPPRNNHQTGAYGQQSDYLAARTTRYPRLRVLGGPYDKDTPSPSTWRFARLALRLLPLLQQPIRMTSFCLGHDHPFARVVSASD